ncbi:MAG: 3-deoxy-manno-octulosonate cytidylyltransferase (CMP-KDO synthetase) [Planctomycetota bacterium]|jgi:3-deoxy-manno-octulosonate cytidylyltransferase (CMP-KDO synthetase)
MAIGIIPARLGSTRLPKKALADIAGKTLIRHVVENAKRCQSLDRIIVATDDPEIARQAELSGVESALTRADHPSGTDRIAEVAKGLKGEIFINIQGDEPEIAPATIDSVVKTLENDLELDLATAACQISELDEYLSPHRVKVVLDQRGNALYFSRSPIPHARSNNTSGHLELPQGSAVALGHIGIYGYRKAALERLVSLKPSPLELCEKLEQLRALQAGMKIGVALVSSTAPGIDTLADLEAFRTRYQDRASG